MESKNIDPRIWKANLQFLKDSDLYKKSYNIDQNESITPTTNKGYLDFKKLKEKLLVLSGKQEEEEVKKQPEERSSLLENELIINTEQKGNSDEEPSYSKEFIHALEEDEVFIKRYQYKDSKTSDVLRFGIKCDNEKLKSWVNTEYNELAEKEAVKISDTLSCISKQSKHNQFTNNIEKYKSQSKQKITSYEKDIVKQAINYLDNIENQTVLVDFFARDKGTGKIKLTKSGEIETHSVVLYKKEDKYLVIDPSNVEFSSILVGAHDDIKICLSKDFKIYTPQSKTGYENELWRDCIDIAVKLAFNLNKPHNYIELKKIGDFQFIDDSSLKKNPAIEAVTNQQNISGTFPSILEEQNARAKQSSDIQESNATSFWIKLLHQKNTILEEKLESSIYTHQKKHYTNKEYLNEYISQKVEIHKDYISSLEEGVGVIDSSINEVDQFNTEKEIELIGKL